jgi:histidinol-phosphate/aromatic aminotransferase/cobyric acid decarboxylase-like protein
VTAALIMPLAISSYDRLETLADAQGLLNLAWTLDESELLAVDLKSLVSLALETELRDGLPYIQSYLVKDPYGEQLLGPAVATFFAQTGWSCGVTCGAGVISLLHALARLTGGKPAYIVGDVYPDFPCWVERSHGRCAATPELGVAEHARRAAALGAALVFLERPSLMGDRCAELADVQLLCAGAEPGGALVVIDESNANYYPANFSAVNLVARLPNLAVLRGFSKAYGMGGLRLAYCVTSRAWTERVRALVPPLLAASFSLKVGKAVLEEGDVAAPLRARIKEQKEETRRILAAAGLGEPLSSSEYLPYVFLRNSPEHIRSRLESRGVLGKFQAVWSEATSDVSYLYRLSAPLRRERMALLRQQLGAGGQG